jgi:lysophospholipase L1-like esterase
MKPSHVLSFLLISLFSLAAVSSFLDKNNVKIGGVELVKIEESQIQKDNISIDSAEIKKRIKLIEDSILIAKKKEELYRKPSKSFQDTLTMLQIESMESPAKFYYSENSEVMDLFFEKLEQTKRDNTVFRILHYGDSQIEMDRISSYIREQLQKTYGGSGMGLLPAMEITPKYTVAIQSTGTWTRKLTFGSKDFRAKHNRYGPMAYFSRLDSEKGKVFITARDNTSFKNKNIKKCKVLIGANTNQIEIKLSSGKEFNLTQIVEPSSREQLIVFDSDTFDFKGKVELEFKGVGAEILGIALDGNSGVSLDNVPMRGCSGLMFKYINSETLRKSYQDLGVKMLILQFGGNALPGMTLKSSADYYGKRFYDEIMYLKSINPDLLIFVIGPADMSVSENGVMQTHLQLENLRDAMKSATVRSGAVFWDMYEAMGGKGSMIQWVKSKPSLGSPDYIHFTQNGANKIAKIFYQSLMKEYEMYKLRKQAN